MNSPKCGILAVALCLLPSLAGAQVVAPKQLVPGIREAIDRNVKAEMQRQDLVGVAIGVIQQGRIVYTQGYGMADRDSKIPFSTSTVTNWASNSKPVVAVRTMQLVESGRMKLSDSIRRFLPELPHHCDPVTIRHILCHQSGYPHYSNGRVVALKKRIPGEPDSIDPVFAINRFGGSPLLRNPGEAYSYSSYAFVLLSAALQRAGKRPLHEQITEHVAAKASIESLELDVDSKEKPSWAKGYKRNLFGKVVAVPEYAHAWKHGAGGYKSDIIDFARWAKALINHRLVSRKSEKKMWTAQKLNSGKPTNAGLGFFVNNNNGKLKIYHGGSHSEARSRMVIYPRERHGVVVLCNCGHADPSRISTAVYRALAKSE